jgi:Fe-S-cluster containining protein
MADHTTFPLDLATPFGRLRATLPLPDRPLRLSELVPLLLQIDGQVVDRALRHAAHAGRPVACGPGCGACCRELVPVSIPEAFAVTAAYAVLETDHRRRVTERFATVAATLERHPELADWIQTPAADDHAVKATAHRYFDLQLPCPFLEDENCSIHRHRPSVCREFNVSSPPALCRDPIANPVESIPSPVQLSNILAHAHAHLYEQPTPQLLPLSLVPRWVADHPELDRLAWPADTLLRDLVSAMQRAMAV